MIVADNKQVHLNKKRGSPDHTGHLRKNYNLDGIIGRSKVLADILKSALMVAPLDVSVLITGKSGTGKTQIAELIHKNSSRRKHPFVELNCAALPENLIENELFGSAAGGHSGATQAVTGKVHAAREGTLFLDEVAELPVGAQSKLLQFLGSGIFYPLGSSKPVKSDVRIITATNINFRESIQMKKFREDLFYRINVLPVPLPTLSERPLCIIPLAEKLLEKAATSLKRTIKGFSAETVDLLQHYHWPGNIRQMANTIERAIILEESDTIHMEAIHLPDINTTQYKPRVRSNEPLIVQEKELIINALEENLWVQKNAAKVLGISPRALNYKVKKFGITHPNWRRNKETQ